MVRQNLILDLNRELIIDNFAGGGGASTGIERALGRHVDHAINHDEFALGMHRINHPQTVHHPTDVFDIDPVKITGGRPVGLGWFSPDCKHFSKAKGGKPLSKKIRGLAFVILRWAKVRVRVIYMENVEEIQTWGPLLHNPSHPLGCLCGHPCGGIDRAHKGRTWKAFIAALGTGVAEDHPDIPEMLDVLNSPREDGTVALPVTKEELVRGFGYEVETKEIRACNHGAKTIRRRLFLVARCDGMPIVWPEPSYARPGTETNGQLPWNPVALCIDWSVPGKSIFLTKEEAKIFKCKRPLARASLKRVATGTDRYILKAKRPFLISLTHQGGERVESVDVPGATITGAHRGEKAVVDGRLASAPFLTEHANATHQRNFPADEPLRTHCAGTKGGHFGLVSASLVREFGRSVGQPVTEAAPTTTCGGGGKSKLLSASLVHLAHGEVDKNGKKRGRGAHDMNESSPAVLATPDMALMSACMVQKGHVHSNSGMVKGADEPMRTQATREEHGLIGASVVKLRGTNVGHPMSEPAHVISAGGQHHGVVSALMVQNNSGYNRTPHRAVDAPCSTITGSGSGQSLVAANLVAYYGNDEAGQAIVEPARTVTVDDRFGLSQSILANVPLMTEEHVAGALRVAAFLREHGVVFEGEYASITVDGHCLVIWDLTLRMLLPRELFRAQGFPEEYIIEKAWLIDALTGEIVEVKLTKEQQIRMCGNSVCPDVAEALVRANSGDMAVWSAKEQRCTTRRRKRGAVRVNELQQA